MISPATSEYISQAAELLKGGDVVGMPTETVYGLAADALNADAVAKIFAVKQRPDFDPLIVHVSSIEEAERIAHFNPIAHKLAEAYWPGPLTMILPKRNCVPDIVTSGLATVGVRMPAHPLALDLIRAAGTPLAAPSANLFGRISPTRASHVVDQLGEKIPMVIDGGPCDIGLESTIVEVLEDHVKALRAGGIAREVIAALNLRVEDGVAVHDRPNAPGMLKSHYAPRKPLRLVEDLKQVEISSRIGVLALSHVPNGFEVGEVLSAKGDMHEAAANLFAAMRRLEAAEIDEIVAESFPQEGIGVAIMDRLTRASQR